MKILLLTPFIPYPPKAANKVRAFSWLRYLSRKYEISLVSFIEREEQKEYLNELGNYCAQILTVIRKPKSGFLYRPINLFQRFPYFMVEHFKSIDMQETIRRLLQKNKFDLVHVSTLAMAQYAGDIKGTAKILDAIDCHTRNYLQQWQFPTGLKNRILSFIDWFKMRGYELKTHSKFNKTILANPMDKEFMLRLCPRLNIEVIPYGVDLEYFSPQQKEEEFPSLIFTGLMGYPPNNDAMVNFCSRTLPLIEEEYAGIKLYIVGGNVSLKLKKIAGIKKNIILTDFQEDIRPFMSKATIFICPLRLGTGVKTKVLEAMAMAKSIVSSSISVEGINAVSEKDILIADRPEEFANAVIRLLKNKDLRDNLGMSARKAVENAHHWQTLAIELDKAYQEVLSEKR